MIEGSWHRRPYEIQAFTHFHATPPWASTKTVAGKPDERSSVYTTLSELRFVTDGDEGTTGPSDPELYPSPISQLHFAPAEDTVTLTTPTELGPPSNDSSLSLSTTDSSSPDTYEDQTRTTTSEQLSSTTDTMSISPQQPGWVVPRLDGLAISDSRRAGRRPLPEVPGHAQTRPLPPRPAKMATVPGSRGSNRFSYPPRQEFVQGCSKNPLVASRPASDSGPDTWSQLMEDGPKHDPAPEDTPPEYHTPASAIISSSATSLPPPPALPHPPTPQSPPSPVIVPAITPRTSELSHPAPILPDLLSPTSIDLVTAAGLTIIGENGEEVLFGALFRDRKVIVIFIRHFLCLFCEDYVRSISNSVTLEILEKRGVDLVLIGSGSAGMARIYKKMARFHFTVYTDPTLQLHEALGLYKTGDVQTEGLRERAVGRSYVKHNGRWTSLRMALRVAAAKAVHIGIDDCQPGDLEQLGGEFVFGPGLKSSFVHKMQNPRDHAPIVEVLEAAGVDVREKVVIRGSDVRGPTPTTPEMDFDITITTSTPEPSPTSLSATTTFTLETTSTVNVSTFAEGEDMDLGLTIPARVGPFVFEPPTPIIADEAEWMVHRTQSLTRIRQKREARRRGDVA